MSSSPLASLRRHCCFTTIQLAEKNFRQAKELVSTGERKDAEEALAFLDAALELHPNWEKALELKARVLLFLKRFKEVVEFLHEFLPGANLAADSVNSLRKHPSCAQETPSDDAWGQVSLARLRRRISSGTMLLGSKKAEKGYDEGSPESRDRSSISKLRQKLSSRSYKEDFANQLGWRFLILGQACCHLGMMEDAMLLLQNGKKTASAASRRYSNSIRDDNFCSGSSIETMHSAEFDLINHMLANIKLLLRRRAAAEAALEAGLYAESVRHFTKIIDNSKSTPPGFIEDCYLHRAIAYQASGRVVDAIADCNRTLALNPRCAKALSVRASLHEMVKSFSECLLDLQQLKMIYEASLRRQQASIDWTACGQSSGQQDSSKVSIMGSLDYINSKIMATRRRLCSRTCSLAARTILDVPQDCSMEDVEKAYLLLSLKHSPDKAALFVENCSYQDRSRDMQTVKEEARASALRLSQLIHKAYTKLLSVISEEEAEEQIELRACEAAFRREGKTPYVWAGSSDEDYLESLCRVECNDEDGAKNDTTFAEGNKLFDGEGIKVSVCDMVQASMEASNYTCSVDVGGSFDAGVGKVGHNDRSTDVPSKAVVDGEGMATKHEAMGEFLFKNYDEREKAIRGCFEAKICKEEGDDKKMVMVIMKALSSFKHVSDDDVKSITAAKIESECTGKRVNGEAHHLVSGKHDGGLSNDQGLANPLLQPFSLDNSNHMAHQRWLMNVSDSLSWNLPLSQPLSVT